jgi:hypothetical protein
MDRKIDSCSVSVGRSCFGCCPASEWWWFRWVLLAQPVFALTLYLLARAGLLS